MSDAKHTPGSWKAGYTEKKSNEVFQLSTSKRIAQCCRTGHSTPETTANAHLIAASPDLLAFAECSAAIDCAIADPAYNAQPVLRSHGWNGEENPGVFLARIRRAALEKAVGHYLGRAAA